MYPAILRAVFYQIMIKIPNKRSGYKRYAFPDLHLSVQTGVHALLLTHCEYSGYPFFNIQ